MSAYPQIMPETGTNFTKTLHNDTYPAIDPATQSDCTGKFVYITGGSKGVGRATAISYAKAGASGIGIGARSDLSSLVPEIEEAAKSAGKPVPTVLTTKLDVLDQASVEAAAKETEKAFGKLDILINNAGYLENFAPLVESDSAEWWTTWEINVRGIYWTTKAFLPLMLKGGDKTIVNLSSIGAHFIRKGASSYQTSKYVVPRLSEFVMADYGEQGVLCYAVHPGGVLTELASKMPEDLHQFLSDKPEVSADTMVYLTSKKRDWLAGRYISCTWDMPELMSREEEIVKGDKLKIRMVV